MKKTLSFISLSLILFSILTNGLLAANSQVVNSNIGNQINSGDFLTSLENNSFKINFKDITSENAGKTIQSWQGKSNFPNKFVLENDFNLEINNLELDKLFVRTNELKDKFTQIKTSGINVGEVTFKEPTLNLLPDRVQIVTETEIKFTTKKQLENIKSNLNIGISTESRDVVNNELSKFETKTTLVNSDLKTDLLSGINSRLRKNIDVDKSVLAGLILECIKEKGVKSPNCTQEKIQNNLDTLEKSIITTETQEFSLLPPNTVFGNIGALRVKPEDVRISKTQISSIFSKYGKFIYGDFSNLEPVEGEREIIRNDENPFEQSNYCQIVSGGDSDKKDECEKLLEEKNNAEAKTYTQNLLNGFTLGESDGYEWKDSVWLHYLIGKKKLASASINFWYSYGFGVRIPIQAEVIIDKGIVDDWENNSKYDISAKVNTLNGTGGYYTAVGLPEEEVFDGKEFVFELGAGLDIKLWVIGDLVDVNESIPLISTFARYFKETGKSFFGFSGDALDEIIANNGFNKSSDFIPPFAGQNMVNLLDMPVDVPVYEIPGLLSLVARIITEVNLNGIIKSKLNQVNTIDCKISGTDSSCPSQITFDTTGYKNFNAKAVFNEQKFSENGLGQYSNFGVELNEFKYIPELVFNIFVKGIASVKIPAWGWESFSTPKIKVYSFTLSSDEIALGTHEGTDGLVSATNNLVYSTNPVIDIELPNIEFSRNDDRAVFSITNNTSSMIKTYYTLDGTTPNCINKGKYYDGEEKVWLTPYSDLVSSKVFTVKAIACSVYGDKTEVATKSTTLTNKAFYFVFQPANGSNVESRSRFVIVSENYSYYDYLKYKYTIDGTIPTCTSGNTFEGEFNLQDLAKKTLKNDFVVGVKGLACNLNNGTLNQINTYNYQVHNTYFNPNISISPSNKVTLGSNYYNQDLFNTYIVYGGEDIDCDSQTKINVHGNQSTESGLRRVGEISLLNGDIAIAPGARIYAKTCIKNLDGNLVFESDLISKTSGGGIIDNYGDLEDRLNGIQFDHRDLGDIFDGFLGADNPDFLNGLGGLINGGNISIDSIGGMNTLMMNGDMAFLGMGSLGKMKNMKTTEMTSGFTTMLRGGQISSTGLSSISTMLKGNKITVKGLTSIGKLYSDYGVSYVGIQSDGNKSDGNKSIPGAGTQTYGNTGGPQTMNYNGGDYNDGVNRKYANTKFQGCDQNDVIIGDDVWSSCNASYNGIGANGTPYILTYGGQDKEARDINGWKYGNLYTGNIFCPAGYKVPTYLEFSKMLNKSDSIIQLRLPAGGAKRVKDVCRGNSSTKPLCTDREFVGLGNKGYYIIEDGTRNYIFNADGSNGGYVFMFINDGAASLRCIRSTPATFTEKNPGLIEADFGETGYNEFTGFTGSNLLEISLPKVSITSSDEYVNEKLNEINDCFKTTYESHLENIEKTISIFENNSEKSRDEETKNKYNKAIDKLEEIKKLYKERYKFIFEY